MSKSIRILFCVVLLSAVPAWGQISLSTTGPAISSIEPTSAAVGAPSVTLTVYGKNFVSGSAITWNGTAMPTTFVASGKLYTVVPGTYLRVAGTVKIAVAARLGSTSTVPFTIVAQSNIDQATGSGQSNIESMTSSTAFALAIAVPGGTVGGAYKASLVKGGTPPYYLGLISGMLPAGVTFDSPSGYLVGAPKTAASYAFGVAVKDSAGHSGSRNYTMSVLASSTTDQMTQIPTVLRITTTSLPLGNVGSAYTVALGATGGKAPYMWKVLGGALPAGLTLNASTGTISGVPSTSGTASFIAGVQDTALATASFTFSINIGANRLIEELPH